jgi:hypothetical protein
MARELVQTRADADTVEALEEFAEEKEITRSEAIRRLLRSGLEAQDEPDDETDGPDDDRFSKRYDGDDRHEGGRIERAGYPRGVIPAILVLVLVSTILLVVDLIVSLGVI